MTERREPNRTRKVLGQLPLYLLIILASCSTPMEIKESRVIINEIVGYAVASPRIFLALSANPDAGGEFIRYSAIFDPASPPSPAVILGPIPMDGTLNEPAIGKTVWLRVFADTSPMNPGKIGEGDACLPAIAIQLRGGTDTIIEHVFFNPQDPKACLVYQPGQPMRHVKIFISDLSKISPKTPLYVRLGPTPDLLSGYVRQLKIVDPAMAWMLYFRTDVNENRHALFWLDTVGNQVLNPQKGDWISSDPANVPPLVYDGWTQIVLWEGKQY